MISTTKRDFFLKQR